MVADVKRMVWATVLVLEIILNVLLPVTVNVDAPVAPPIFKLLYVKLPPAKVLAVAELSVNEIVDVPGDSVKPVVVVVFQTIPVPVNEIKLPPKVIERVLVFDDVNVKQVRL